jgi:hypothetical protein
METRETPSRHDIWTLSAGHADVVDTGERDTTGTWESSPGIALPWLACNCHHHQQLAIRDGGYGFDSGWDSGVGYLHDQGSGSYQDGHGASMLSSQSRHRAMSANLITVLLDVKVTLEVINSG